MRKEILILILLSAVTFLALGGYLLYNNWKTNIMKIPPEAPSNLVAQSLSATDIKLTWRDNSNNELGFQVIRDGQVLCDLPECSEEYLDGGLRPATNYRYEVIAYNLVGENTSGLYVVRTKNPPIRVWIDKIGVHENGEEGELLREYDLLGKPGKGEVRIGLVVTDGKTTIEKRLPSKGVYELLRDEVIPVDSLLFETKEVGDYLRFFATAYEDDGGLGEQLIYKALDIATGSYINMPTSILLKLAGVDFAKIYAELFGAEDDWLGSYVSEWTSSDNWGVGNYVDIKCKRDNGNIGLRLWFRVVCPVYDYSLEKTPTQ